MLLSNPLESLASKRLGVTLAALCLATLTLLAVAPGASAEVPSTDYDRASAQEFVEQYTGRHGLPGASYVVVRDGENVTEGGTGTVAADQPLSVGSVSKSFTAFAVLQLVDQHRVALDAPITDYLPEFKVQGADARQITIRRLLSHTSGLPNPVIVPSTGGSLAEDVANIADQNAASDPGTSYLYSNLNYRTLARLVEVVSGSEFDQYLQTKIFDPLGMHHTTSRTLAGPAPGLQDGHATAYGTALELPELAASIGGAGGVISTAHDMGLWLGMQQRGGVTADGTRLLSEALVTESHTVQPAAGTYGFGWQHTSTADPARIGHDGALTRFSSRQDLVPSNGYATAVLLDSYTPTYQHPFEISTGLIELSQGQTPEVGAPVATIIDLALAALTLIVVALGVRGGLRARRWAEKRSKWPLWRFALRLLPQIVLPVVAVFLFVGLTSGRGNPATPVDVFGLWPAAMVLVLTGAAVGVALIVLRCAGRSAATTRS